jgi:hypothetical protein
MKSIGIFWAWGLIVAAFALTAVTNILSLALVFALPIEQVSALLDQFGSSSIWSGVTFNLTSSFLLAIGMWGVYKLFSNTAKPAEVAAGRGIQ